MDGMPRPLGYSDAVRLLGGQDSKVVAALEKITGGLLLLGTPAVPTLLGWFDAKAEFVRLSHELVRGFSERRSGLSRHTRTERLEAAHAVLVIAAFFDSLTRVDLPKGLDANELAAAEQLAVAARAGSDARHSVAEAGTNSLLALIMSAGQALPHPQQSPELFLTTLQTYYADLAGAFSGFLAGLAVWEALPETARREFDTELRKLPALARIRYEDDFRRLAADFPEMACWAAQREHRATRAALAGLEELLRDISTGRAPDDRRASLARAYRAELDRLIVESGDVPDGIRVPKLGEAYLPPRFRAADVPSAAKVSEESWWHDVPVRNDLPEFLIGHLTSPQATRAPLLVLGQPGSGKSVLTRVLAARLPAADFLPIRVILRDAPAADDVQDQIEHAIRQATGERVEWPALARAAGDAMPVIMLDGFDELLQAVGVSQTDYLVKVARFQRREAEQGRPVAVIVTSRTAVADRARAPEQTVALRLEPFDDERVTAWLDIWNSTNAQDFAAHGLQPLDAEIVLAHRSLAEQPLLLLMLALYDADGNALQRVGADLRAHELYERLLRSFAVREITRHRPGLPEHELHTAIENELRRLSVVAFAMFNRAALWVTENDLEQDLVALLGPARPPAGADLRTPLRTAELTLGRFFFIHRARAAAQDETRLETYEFLHATFGEFLVARLTWHILRDMAAREAASTLSFGAEPVEDDLLRALLSFEPLTLRGPIIAFLTDMIDPAHRPVLEDLLTRLFRRVNHAPPAVRYLDYRPQSPGEPPRYAAYSANLLLLVLCAVPETTAGKLFGLTDGVAGAWHRQVLLWRSQLTMDGWDSLTDALALERIWVDRRRDVRVWLDDGTFASPEIDPYWTFDIAPGSSTRGSTGFAYSNLHGDKLRRKAYLQCGLLDDVSQLALEPVVTSLSSSVNTIVAWWPEHSTSAARALLELMMNPSPDAYRLAADIATHDFPPWRDEEQDRYQALVLNQLAAGRAATPALVAEILDQFCEYEARAGLATTTMDAVVKCALNHLGHDDEADPHLATTLAYFLFPRLTGLDAVVTAEALVRLAELNLTLPEIPELSEPDAFAALLNRVSDRPRLAKRLAELAPKPE
ncbi:hypothetical protein SAMN06264365_12146 [Actinoplanes regularis]|uniref:AAA+ ATPase domain-containing protein n=2 Tax=Actinoplanes regularis TaxID=52697 RepID=A0A239GHS7_9ACTN|nr:hypothetical protein Are01nite_71120 [Actinoplanes regularis]SNS68856.1 hypothetical protein SAMN06264365_12146 [Actinoplanes regularis]